MDYVGIDGNHHPIFGKPSNSGHLSKMTDLVGEWRQERRDIRKAIKELPEEMWASREIGEDS